MAERDSGTHEHVVMKQDNGELQEDVVPSSDLEGGDGNDGGRAGRAGRVDEDVEESFPASDPPSHWSGPAEDVEDAQGARGPGDRLVDRRPAEHPPERAHPAEPKPQTLTKD